MCSSLCVYTYITLTLVIGESLNTLATRSLSVHVKQAATISLGSTRLQHQNELNQCTIQATRGSHWPAHMKEGATIPTGVHSSRIKRKETHCSGNKGRSLARTHERQGQYHSWSTKQETFDTWFQKYSMMKERQEESKLTTLFPGAVCLLCTQRSTQCDTRNHTE